jgi:tight adherence protein C
MVILAVALAFASIFLLTTGLLTRQTDPVETRLEAIRAGVRPQAAALNQPFFERAILPLFAAVAGLILKLLPLTWVKATGKRLVWAHNPMSLPTFVLIWAAFAAAVPVIALLFARRVGADTFLTVLSVAVGVFLGGVTPQLWLGMKVADRSYRARKQLPDALDLMTTSVEAGLSLDAALARVAEHHTGPLQEELARALQEMTLGMPRRDALLGMTERIKLPELLVFVQALNQAEVTGAPIAQVLRVQAEQVRIKRRQTAEAQAQRAPLYMVLAIVFFILPSLFLLLLGAVGLTVLELLSDSEIF